MIIRELNIYLIMGRKVTVITSAIAAQAQLDLNSIGSKGIVANRLQAIISAQKHSIKKVCEVLDLNRSTINKWMKSYKEKGVNGLLNEGKPPRSKLKKEHKIMLTQWIEEKPSSTLKELALKCAAAFGITIGISSIHRELVKLGFAHITGRKKHYQADVQAQSDFKKN
jgi:transposase